MDIEIYDEVADKIRSRMQKINKVLSSCELDSKLAKEGTEDKFENIFCINTNDIVMKKRSSKHNDLSKISELVKKLEINPKTTEIPKKKARSESVNSLASDDSNRDYRTEVLNHLKEMREIIGSIQNTCIEENDDDSAFEAVTTFNNNFLELVFGLQRIAREVTMIASNDNIPSDSFSLSFLDNKFIDQLRQLDKCLGDMQRLDENKNPITNLERKGNLKLDYTTIINNILETISKNPH